MHIQYEKFIEKLNPVSKHEVKSWLGNKAAQETIQLFQKELEQELLQLDTNVSAEDFLFQYKVKKELIQVLEHLELFCDKTFKEINHET
jgi:hypothetical protein